MPNFNKVILMGNITRDPQLKHLPSGTSVAEFGLAVNRKWKTENGQEREDVLFIDCAAFGRTGEVIAEHCAKGRPLHIEGRLKLDQWDDKETGAKRSKISVIVDSFQFVGDRRQDGDEDRDAPRQPAAPARSAPARRPAAAPPQSGDEWREEDSVPF